MAIRGHAEKDGNLYHLLLHMAKYESDLQLWIDDYRYMSHDIITELIALMGQRLLRQLTTTQYSASFTTLVSLVWLIGK